LLFNCQQYVSYIMPVNSIDGRKMSRSAVIDKLYHINLLTM